MLPAPAENDDRLAAERRDDVELHSRAGPLASTIRSRMAAVGSRSALRVFDGRYGIDAQSPVLERMLFQLRVHHVSKGPPPRRSSRLMAMTTCSSAAVASSGRQEGAEPSTGPRR